MRVISQDGTMDFPYDSCVFQEYKNEIWCINYSIFHDEEGYRIATYSSEEKALKAMEMLRSTYRNNTVSYRLLGSCSENKINGEHSWFEEVIESVYFQFPKDDEVEV